MQILCHENVTPAKLYEGARFRENLAATDRGFRLRNSVVQRHQLFLIVTLALGNCCAS